MLDPTNADGSAMLKALHASAKTRYNLGANTRLNLLQFGISQGGGSTLGFHMDFLENVELQMLYDLKLSVPISGQYSDQVWKSSVLLIY